MWRVIWTEEMRCVLSMPFGKPRRGNCLEQLDQDFQTYDKRAQNGGRKDFLGTRHSLLSQILFILPEQRLCIVKNMYVYTHIYLHRYCI